MKNFLKSIAVVKRVPRNGKGAAAKAPKPTADLPDARQPSERESLEAKVKGCFSNYEVFTVGGSILDVYSVKWDDVRITRDSGNAAADAAWNAAHADFDGRTQLAAADIGGDEAVFTIQAVNRGKVETATITATGPKASVELVNTIDTKHTVWEATARQWMEEAETDIDTLKASVAANTEGIANHSANIISVMGDVASLKQFEEEAETTIDTHSTDIADLQASVAALQSEQAMVPAYQSTVPEFDGTTSGERVLERSANAVDGVFYDTSSKKFIARSGASFYTSWNGAADFGTIKVGGVQPAQGRLYYCSGSLWLGTRDGLQCITNNQ